MQNRGKRFGHLVVIDKGQDNRKYLCKCDCGTNVEVFTSNLYAGRTTSCGCQNSTKEYPKEMKHLRSYILRKRGKDTLCAQWRDNPKEFYNWLEKNGWEKGKTVTRIKNGTYSPENCKLIRTNEIEWGECPRYISYDRYADLYKCRAKGKYLGSAKTQDDAQKIVKDYFNQVDNNEN